MGIISQLTQHSIKTPGRLQAGMETIYQLPQNQTVNIPADSRSCDTGRAAGTET